MNKTTKRTLMVFAGMVLLMGSCYSFRKPMLLKMYGIHKPQVESEQSIRAAARKYEMDTGNIVTVSPEGYSSLFKNFGNGVPDALIFDKMGNYIEYRATDSSCNAGVFGFIPSLERNGHYKITGRTTLYPEWNKLRNLSGNALSSTYIDTSADFIIMISWVAWAGKLNRDHVSEWEKLAGKNSKARIQTIAVNFDTQQWWPQAAKDSIMQKQHGI